MSGVTKKIGHRLRRRVPHFEFPVVDGEDALDLPERDAPKRGGGTFGPAWRWSVGQRKLFAKARAHGRALSGSSFARAYAALIGRSRWAILHAYNKGLPNRDNPPPGEPADAIAEVLLDRLIAKNEHPTPLMVRGWMWAIELLKREGPTKPSARLADSWIDYCLPLDPSISFARGHVRAWLERELDRRAEEAEEEEDEDYAIDEEPSPPPDLRLEAVVEERIEDLLREETRDVSFDEVPDARPKEKDALSRIESLEGHVKLCQDRHGELLRAIERQEREFRKALGAIERSAPQSSDAIAAMIRALDAARASLVGPS